MATAAAPSRNTSSLGAARGQLSRLKTFTWEGKDKRGVVMRGESLSKNENLVKADLRRQGITPNKVSERKEGMFGASGSRITPREIAIFSRQLATMMASGVPMVQAFDIIAGGQKNPRMRKMLTEVKTSVEGGSSLSESITQFPVQFDELYRNLVKAGETAGVLDTVLDTIATYKENIESLKGKIKKALFYPTMVIAVAILVSAVLLIFVVPQFEVFFKQFGSDLPAFTQIIVNASRFVIGYWWLILMVVGGTVFGLLALVKRSKTFAHTLDRLYLKIPVIGQIMHNSAIARFGRTLAVPLVDALDTVAGATGSVVYSTAVMRMKGDVSVGYPLNVAMRQVNLFPNMVVQMTAIGEEAGALDTMLFKVAEFYEEEVNNAVDALSSLIEPFIMIIIGGLVGSMVIGMYLPVFKLAATL